MKFQKDNSQNRLTPEIVSARREAALRRQEYEAQRIAELMQQAEDRKLIQDRLSAYPSIQEQLDMLWHDISDGKIQADTTSLGTWYQKIKEVKENNPLPK